RPRGPGPSPVASHVDDHVLRLRPPVSKANRNNPTRAAEGPGYADSDRFAGVPIRRSELNSSPTPPAIDGSVEALAASSHTPAAARVGEYEGPPEGHDRDRVQRRSAVVRCVEAPPVLRACKRKAEQRIEHAQVATTTQA